jgi:hypothetical protein
MRRTLRDLADARKELLEIQEEFIRLQKRIDAVRDCVTDSLTRIFGEERPAMAALAEEELIERIAGRVVALMGSTPTFKPSGDKRYVRDTVAAKLLGVSAKTLRCWRGRRPYTGPPVTRIDRMVLYSVRELERFMEERTSTVTIVPPSPQLRNPYSTR